MYRWYKEAVVCYAFLVDVTTEDANFLTSAWFSRGWTLQELLAPVEVLFFDSYWIPLGSKIERGAEIQQRTGIPRQALESFIPDDYCVAERMSWAVTRCTTRTEDRACSLFGLFDVNLPLLYGEGGRAFIWLQEEILRTEDDANIFAWSGPAAPAFGMLALSPEAYQMPHSLEDDLEVYPSDYAFILEKSGISGHFYMCPHVFDVHFAVVAWFTNTDDDCFNFDSLLKGQWTGKRTVVGIFLHYVTGDIFRRVRIDGKACEYISIDSTQARTLELKQVSIGRGRMDEVDTSHLHLPQTTSSQRTWIQPGLIYTKSVYSKAEQWVKNLFVEAPTNDLVILNPETKWLIECLCIRNNVAQTTIIHFGPNLKGENVAFLSYSFRGSCELCHLKDESYACCDAGCILLVTGDDFAKLSEYRPSLTREKLRSSSPSEYTRDGGASQDRYARVTGGTEGPHWSYNT